MSDSRLRTQPASRRLPTVVLAGLAAIFPAIFGCAGDAKSSAGSGSGGATAPASKSLEEAVADVVGDPQKIVYRTTWPETDAKRALVIADTQIHHFVRDAGGSWSSSGQLYGAQYSPDDQKTNNPTWAAFAKNGSGGLYCVNNVGGFSVQPFQVADDKLAKGVPDVTAEELEDLKRRLLDYLKDSFPSADADRSKRQVDTIVSLFFPGVQ